EAQEEYECERGQYDHPAEGAGIDKLAECRKLAVGDGEVECAPSGHAGDYETERHQVIDPDHIGAKAFVYGSVCVTGGRDTSLIIAHVFSHDLLFFFCSVGCRALALAPLAELQHA